MVLNRFNDDVKMKYNSRMQAEIDAINKKLKRPWETRLKLSRSRQRAIINHFIFIS